MKNRFWPLASPVAVAVVVSLLSLKFLPAPWTWIGGLGFVVSLWLAAAAASTSARMACVGVGTLLLMLSVFEAYLAIDRYVSRKTMANEPDLTRPHDLLGYFGNADVTVSSARYYRNEAIYRATYHLDDHGVRITPMIEGAPSNPQCVLFFGGSFTFGEGVEDDETLPYLVQRESLGRFRAHNLGFIGYGPHQMLVMLEHSLESQWTDCERPGFAIYQGIVDHARRVAGRAAWDRKGPRFVLEPGGGVRAAGFYEHGPDAPPRQGLGRITSQLEKSLLVRRILAGRDRRVGPADVELYAAILQQAQRTFETRYPGGSFQMIFWDDPAEEATDALLEAIERRDIPVHRISDILPGYREDRLRYALSPHDEHPSAEAHHLIAKYVVESILAD